MVSQVFGLVIWHLPLIFQILLVADQDPRDIFLSVLVYLTHPLGHLGERVSISDIVGDDDTVGTLVVRGSDSLKSLLACSIPNLQFDGFSVYVNRSDFEVHTNRRHEVVMEDIIL